MIGVLSIAGAALAGCEGGQAIEPEFDSDIALTVIPPGEVDAIIADAQASASIQIAKIAITAGRYSVGVETSFTLTTKGSAPETVNNPLWYTAIQRHELSHSFNGEVHYDGAGFGTAGSVPWTQRPIDGTLATQHPHPFYCELATTSGWVSGSSQHLARWDMIINPIGDEPNHVNFTVAKGPSTDFARADCPIAETDVEEPASGGEPGGGTGGGGGGECDEGNPCDDAPTWCWVRYWYWMDTGQIIHYEVLYCY